jgi:hypothetical protein
MIDSQAIEIKSDRTPGADPSPRSKAPVAVRKPTTQLPKRTGTQVTHRPSNADSSIPGVDVRRSLVQI